MKKALEMAYSKVKRFLIYIKKHPFKSILYSLLTIVCFVLLLVLSIYAGLFGKLPSKDYLLQLKTPLTSTLYASNGEQISLYYLQNRSNADSTEIPKALRDALIATEDIRFFEHKGIDYKSYARVFVKSILLQQNTGGGSTITQQVAKNTFGRKEYLLLTTPINKIKEIFIAKRLEDIYSKEEIMLLYFNTVTFGENIYGIEKAAYRFFNKKPKNLSVSECATLVGLLKATTYYNPRRNPKQATERRNTVLQQMEKYGFLSAEEKEKALQPLVLNYQVPMKNSSGINYFKAYVELEFKEWAKNNPAPDGHTYNIETDGLHIYSTLNASIQKSSERAMLSQIENLQKMMDQHWDALTTKGGKSALLEKLISQTAVVKKWKSQELDEEKIERLILEKKNRKYWTLGLGYENKLQSLEDSIASSLNRLHAGLLTMHSKTGRIMGYVGGIDYGFSQKDNILEAKQVGSIFKPITYLAALESGKSPCDYYNNTLISYTAFDNWKPRNADGVYGGSYSLHGALAKSVNTVSVQIQLQTGIENTRKLAEKMGITASLPSVPSLVLGTGNVSLMEMVSAYASISNGGKSVKPLAIERIENDKGQVLYNAKSAYGKQVASEENIKLMQKMMGNVLTEGTAARIQNYEIPYNLIGKTGTTQNNGDGWFIASSPEIVVGSWVGTYDKRVQFKSTSMGSGANTALPMVASVFKSLSSWKKTMLTQFTYDLDYFECPPFLEMNAQEAIKYVKTDSTYLLEKQINDTLLRQVEKEKSLPSDSISIPPNEKTALDSLLN